MPVEISQPLILLSGLGADARQFDPQRPVFTNLHVPRWLPHDEGESLRAYARRVAETLDPPYPFYLGGSSFGGMVAQEIAHVHRPEVLFLIGSARRGDQIATHLKYFVGFASILPQRVFEAAQSLTSLYASKFGRLDAQQKELLAAMVADTVPSFVRWGIAAITEWEGAGELDIPIHHIHGSDDELIPVENVHPDVTVSGAGHLLNVTHADEVNAFIAARIVRPPTG